MRMPVDDIQPIDLLMSGLVLLVLFLVLRRLWHKVKDDKQDTQ